MASTALVTFFLDDIPLSHSIYLYGSWDNFTTGYSMGHDPKRGKGNWRGCHYFQNIICDGRFDQVTGPRQGALKLGGRYYYYYKRDGDIEFHNVNQPSTTACPMLPGQAVNILDVPVELSDSAHSSRSLTLTPDDRYAMLTPPAVLMKSDLTPCEQIKRQNWLTHPFGRLQTAALETCRSGFKRYASFGRSVSNNDAYCEKESRITARTRSGMERCVSRTVSRTEIITDRPCSRYGSGGRPLSSKGLRFIDEKVAQTTIPSLENDRFVWFQPTKVSVAQELNTPLLLIPEVSGDKLKTPVVNDSVSGLCNPFHAPSTPKNSVPKKLPHFAKTRRPAHHNSVPSWTSLETVSTIPADDTASPMFSSAGQSYTSPASSYYPSPLRKRNQSGLGLSSSTPDYDKGYPYHRTVPIPFAAKLDYLRPVGMDQQNNPGHEVHMPAKETSTNQPLIIAMSELDFEIEGDTFKDMGYLGAIIH